MYLNWSLLFRSFRKKPTSVTRCWNKQQPNLYKMCPIGSGNKSFYLKDYVFQKRLFFGYFCEKTYEHKSPNVVTLPSTLPLIWPVPTCRWWQHIHTGWLTGLSKHVTTEFRKNHSVFEIRENDQISTKNSVQKFFVVCLKIFWATWANVSGDRYILK